MGTLLDTEEWQDRTRNNAVADGVLRLGLRPIPQRMDSTMR